MAHATSPHQRQTSTVGRTSNPQLSMLRRTRTFSRPCYPLPIPCSHRDLGQVTYRSQFMDDPKANAHGFVRRSHSPSETMAFRFTINSLHLSIHSSHLSVSLTDHYWLEAGSIRHITTRVGNHATTTLHLDPVPLFRILMALQAYPTNLVYSVGALEPPTTYYGLTGFLGSSRCPR